MRLTTFPGGYGAGMSENTLSPDPDQPDEEDDQDAGPSTMAPPGEGADDEGMVG